MHPKICHRNQGENSCGTVGYSPIQLNKMLYCISFSNILPSYSRTPTLGSKLINGCSQFILYIAVLSIHGISSAIIATILCKYGMNPLPCQVAISTSFGAGSPFPPQSPSAVNCCKESDDFILKIKRNKVFSLRHGSGLQDIC